MIISSPKFTAVKQYVQRNPVQRRLRNAIGWCYEGMALLHAANRTSSTGNGHELGVIRFSKQRIAGLV